MHRISKQIYNRILESNKLLLIPHKNPDLDALGSVVSFIQFLKTINKNYAAFCISEIPENMRILPNIEEIKLDLTIFNKPDFDTIIVFDSGDLAHTGIKENIEKLPKDIKIINIDHHSTNIFFGDYNMVITDASSTTEVLYYFFKKNNVPITQMMATGICSGLIFDTDFFSNSATSEDAFHIASKMILRGGNMNQAREILFKNKTIEAMRLWGDILSRLKKHDTLDVVYTYITQEDIIKHNSTDKAAEGFANFMNMINESKICLILNEMPGNKIKGSFRTRHHDIDVAHIAKQLGGGGHKKAAGFTIDGPLKPAAQQVFAKIKECDILAYNNQLPIT